MPGQRPILAMGFIASLGLVFVVLACSVPKEDRNFWPMMVFVFNIFLPIPTFISKRIIIATDISADNSRKGRVRDFVIFFTTGIMVSSMAIPIILARTPVEKPLIAPISCFLVEIGNILCYATIGLFCIYFKSAD